MDSIPPSPMLRQNRSQSLNSTNTSSARSKANAGSVSSLCRTDSSFLGNKDYAIGILLLLVVVFLWTTSNFVTQDLFQDGYEKAFLVTYLNTSAFSLYLLPFLIKSFLPKITTTWRFRKTARYDSGQYEPLHSEDVYADDDNSVETYLHERGPSESSELPPFTVRETADLAFIFCFIWFAANWTLNASLDYTSVASATILSSTSGFFTLGLGRIFRVETLTLAKIGAVSTSFVGVLLVALSDSSQTTSESDNLVSTSTSTRHALGDSLALFSAVFYALYVILLKVRIRSESRIDMKMFFGFVGLFNIILCWPIGVILHLTGIERFELPTSERAVGALLVNMAITWSSDYLYVLAMLKTTPLVVTIGLSLTIPLAVLGDFFLSNPVRSPVLAGALLVLMSFVVVGVDDANAEQQQQDLVDASRNLVDDPDRP
ncbi:uncharacterized protein C8R40DRAFT_1080972 [Lentinula edodes]|uniref:uncharacterized protein n=1 Tax=Lentinula edodes TaxID=5353 RepID=UPI001E8E6B5F|nr:uncharacterized protein C8R40DRAFT_1080972 [Lentinula edodes]KAH7880600.1 hypothetical protein C8R40DRAFT_1080972 [Lentinula edodes]